MSVIPFPVARSAAPAVVPEASLPDGASWVALWVRRIRHRRALAALDLAQIREVGLDPVRVHAEAVKPFWRA